MMNHGGWRDRTNRGGVHSRGPVNTGGRQVTGPRSGQSQLPRNCLRPPEFCHRHEKGRTRHGADLGRARRGDKGVRATAHGCKCSVNVPICAHVDVRSNRPIFPRSCPASSWRAACAGIWRPTASPRWRNSRPSAASGSMSWRWGQRASSGSSSASRAGWISPRTGNGAAISTGATAISGRWTRISGGASARGHGPHHRRWL
jgi:hypothetical protein